MHPSFRDHVILTVAVAGAGLAPLAGCADLDRTFPDPPSGALAYGELREVGRSEGYQWTGVAVSESGRVFVNYPRWHTPHSLSAAEIVPGGMRVRAYPDETWNAWTPESGLSPEDHFVCVQAVHVDAKDRLWVLDPASPRMEGVVPGGAKLVEIDPSTDELVRVIRFDETVAPEKSYLNDLRVDTRDDYAFITDSGLGAVVVVDLKAGTARRVLDGHPSTRAEDITLVVEGRELRRPDGTPPRVHADGIALDAERGLLYYQALTGRTLYRVPTELLKDPKTPPEEIAAAVERVGATFATDGMEIDTRGNIYFTAIERDAIVARRPDGTFVTIAADPRIAWPDSFSFGPHGMLYFTTSQIHRTPMLNAGEGGGGMPATPYHVFMMRPIAGPNRR